LKTGDNLISLPLVPQDDDIEAILAPIIEEVNDVWGYDNENKCWSSYIPNGPTPTLTTMEVGKAYWIDVQSDCTLTVVGDEGPDVHGVLDLDMPAWSSWNMLGSLCVNGEWQSDPAGKVTDIQGWDADQQEYYTVGPADPLEEGKGYWVQVSQDCDIEVTALPEWPEPRS
jgi:hypothetical protein